MDTKERVNNALNLLRSLDGLCDIIKKDSELRGWNIPPIQIERLRANLKGLHNNDNDLSSISTVDVWAGHTLAYNVFEALGLLSMSVNKELKLNFKIDFSYKELIDSLDKVILPEVSEKKLDLVRLDFNRLSEPDYMPESIASNPNAGLWLVALNPRLCLLADKQPIRLFIRDPRRPENAIAALEIKLVDNTVSVINIAI